MLLTFFMSKKPNGVGNIQRKVERRMKRKTHERYKKRTQKPAVKKQLMERKRAQKAAKYPMRAKQHYQVPIRVKRSA